MEWRKNALQGEWDRFLSLNMTEILENNTNPPKFIFNGDLKWFYFHMEAYEQRKYVMSNIKPLNSSAYVLDNLEKIVTENLPAMVEDWADKILPPPRELKEKHRWISITLRNMTPFPIK